MRRGEYAVAAMLWLAGAAAAQSVITSPQSFQGLSADGLAPPNTTGKAGATQFVQFVNNEYAVYEKSSGRPLQGPRAISSFWQETSGPCAAPNGGEAMVEYDKAPPLSPQNGRWVMAELTNTNPAYYCFAVSETPDATGAFYPPYAFKFVKGQNPSRPRLGVWPDAYYASFNIQPSGEAAAPLAVAYDRLDMIKGHAALAPVVRHPKAQINFLPADFDGSTPPTPGDYYLEVGGSSFLSLWRFFPNFQDPSSSKFTPIARKLMMLSTHGVGCSINPSQWDQPFVPQEGAPQALLLAYPEQLMYRLAWRNVGGVEHLVANETVVLSSTPPVAGLVWFDIESPASEPVVKQEGVVAQPVSANASSYWIGSLAQDLLGDIALGFNASGPQQYPSLELAGQVFGGKADTMISLGTLVTGGGAQTNTAAWGTHADMSVDPTDDCTFWFTGEYVATPSAGFDWTTLISSFQFTACQPPPATASRTR